MKIITLSLLFFVVLQSVSQNHPSDQIPELTQKANIKVNFLPVGMPEGEADMGLAGIHYNLLLNNWIYAGVGMYTAVSGTRGGLFTLGVNLGINRSVYKNIFVDTGIYFGGGGGAGSPDGGGAFILPHFNLGYAFKKFSLEAGYSYINFFNGGDINSSQWNAAVQIPLEYHYTTFDHAGTTLTESEISKQMNWQQKSRKFSVLFHFNNHDLMGDTKDTDGLPMDDKMINTVGIELNSYLKGNTFFFIKADGAYNGIESGYMDMILGLGYDFSFNRDRTRILGKFGVGGAGGGGVDTDGGFVIYPDLSFEQKIFDDVFVSLNKGFLLSPDASFLSSTYGIGFKYFFNQNGLISKDDQAYTFAKFKGKEFILGEEFYFNVARNYEDLLDQMQQIVLQLNFYLKKNIYLAGQAAFANFGDAGAYAEGLGGIGFSTSGDFSARFQLFGQILAGAAGGGWIDTGEGLIIKPSAGGSVFFNDKLGLRLAVGQAKAVGGGLNSTFASASLSYRLALLKAK